jgi:hypothetical protein
MSHKAFYLAQAARCALAAAGTEFLSERNRLLDAEKIWRTLAEIPFEEAQFDNSAAPERGPAALESWIVFAL